MIVLRIEHPVADYDVWKAAFDGDPLGRPVGGVRRFRVLRPIDDAGRVAIDLEFDDQATAARFGERLAGLWASPEAAALGIGRPQMTFAEIADHGAY